jgi:hypothetical protein
MDQGRVYILGSATQEFRHPPRRAVPELPRYDQRTPFRQLVHNTQNPARDSIGVCLPLNPHFGPTELAVNDEEDLHSTRQ